MAVGPMLKNIGRPALKKLGYWAVLLALPLLYIGLEVYMGRYPFLEPLRMPQEEHDFTLLAIEQKALDVLVQTSALLVTLATLVIAGASTVFQKSPSRSRPTDRDQLIFILTCFLAGVSILAGLLALRTIGDMLILRTYNLEYDLIHWPTRVQWAGLILSAFFAIDLFYHRALESGDTPPGGR